MSLIKLRGVGRALMAEAVQLRKVQDLCDANNLQEDGIVSSQPAVDSDDYSSVDWGWD